MDFLKFIEWGKFLRRGLVLLVAIDFIKGECRKGFVADSNDEFCYQVFLERKNWTEARITCSMVDADLAKEDDPVSSQILSEITSEVPRYYWIGLNDIETEGNHVWLDGTALDTSKWDPRTSQPNGGSSQSCVVGLESNNLWEDKACSDSNSFVCAYKQGEKPQVKSIVGFRSWASSEKHRSILGRYHTKSIEECARLCSNTKACVRFSFNPGKTVSCLLGMFGPSDLPTPVDNGYVTYTFPVI